ncbi:MAG: carbonate dehydratase [Oscillochloris sp.]|nr:carbonate dehydratase [Oscillochloris sp.]
MDSIGHLLAGNKAWADRITAKQPDFFHHLAAQQAPQYLWIGCSDSRVPATELVDLLPGEMFVHRNIANIVVHSDLNCLAVLQYGIEVLHVNHIIVCGHYGCGGIEAVLHNRTYGMIDNWLRHVHDVRTKHAALLNHYRSDEERFAHLCELNVIEQVLHVCQTTVVQQAWKQGQAFAVHGVIYDVADGRLRDLGMTIDRPECIEPHYDRALARISS